MSNKLKKKARKRMAQTGESYTSALRWVHANKLDELRSLATKVSNAPQTPDVMEFPLEWVIPPDVRDSGQTLVVTDVNMLTGEITVRAKEPNEDA